MSNVHIGYHGYIRVRWLLFQIFPVCSFRRLSRDEKFYQKELEAALEASMKDSQQSPENDSNSTVHDNDDQDLSDDEGEMILSKPKKPRLLPSSDTEDNNKENSG